jgi:TolB-like protein
MTRRAFAVLALAAVAVAGAGGCGYRLAGGNTFLPPHVRVIVITPFENQTTRPEIEQRVTEEVAREFAKRGGYKVVAETAGADALLEGAVTDLRTNPVQFNEEGRATRVETVVLIRATLRDLASDQVLWSQAGLPFREQYDVPESQTEFVDQESLALDEIARGAAGALVSSILEGF